MSSGSSSLLIPLPYKTILANSASSHDTHFDFLNANQPKYFMLVFQQYTKSFADTIQRR